MSSDIIDTFGVPEFFCEALAKVEQIGPCRRLIFTINRGGVSTPVASMVFPAEVLAEIAQMLAADVQTPPRLASLRTPTLAN